MKTVGYVLKNARISKDLTLPQVEQATKIKVRVLEKIEADQISKFGSFGHLLGLVKNYGEFLDLNSEYLTAVLRRQVDFSSSFSHPIFSLPKFLPLRIYFLVPLALILIFVYLTFQLASLRTGPKLEVSQPQAGAVVNLSRIQIKGVTEAEAQITVNGQKVPTNLSGEFSTEFELTPGVNLIEIVAKKGDGVERKIVRTVEFAN